MHILRLFLLAIPGWQQLASALIQVPPDRVGLLVQPGVKIKSYEYDNIESNLDLFDDEDDDTDDDGDIDDDSDNDINLEFTSDYEDEEGDVKPPPSSSGKLKSVLHLPTDILTCGNSPFNTSAVSAAISAALTLIQERIPWKNKPREQPHWFNNHEGFDFPDCTEGRMFEFPILIGGEVHRGGRTGNRAPPGAHRVIFKADEDGNGGTFCGLITHENAERWGSFVTCE